jgi:hypothetical protein
MAEQAIVEWSLLKLTNGLHNETLVQECDATMLN